MLKKAAAVRAAAIQAQAMGEGTSMSVEGTPQTPGPQTPQASAPGTATTNPAITDPAFLVARQAADHVEEILQSLKSTFPLLILSLETMVDQIQSKFKLTPEEDMYRIIMLLLGEAIHVRRSLHYVASMSDADFQGYVLRMNNPDEDPNLTQNTIQTIQRMGQGLPPALKVRMARNTVLVPYGN